MPFKSKKQRSWMWANEPEMAKRWEDESEGKDLKKPKKKNPKRQARKGGYLYGS